MGPTILLTNDDGIRAPGLLAMLEALSEWAKVYVVAPDSERSGVGCAVTLTRDLESVPADKPPAAAAWAISGTPADSVKLGVAELLPERADMVVSGINRGPNVGVNVFYSGTVAAAIEAAVLGLPSVAVSLDYAPVMPFELAAERVTPVVRAVLEKGLGRGYLVNVNVPNVPAGEMGPAVLTRHGRAGFREFYRPGEEAGSRAPGARRWRIDGEYSTGKGTAESDAVALAEGFVSVTPMEIDLTAKSFITGAGEWEFLRDGNGSA